MHYEQTNSFEENREPLTKKKTDLQLGDLNYLVIFQGAIHLLATLRKSKGCS